MSSPDFHGRYRLLTVVAHAGGVRTHSAEEVATGRPVMVHLLDDPGPDAGVALERRLVRLPEAERSRVLETATLPSGFAVVTEVLTGLESFPDWVASRSADDDPRPAPRPAAGTGAAGRTDAADVSDTQDGTVTAESPAPGALDRDAHADPPQAIEFTIGGEDAQAPFLRLFMASGRLNLETLPEAPQPLAVPGYDVPSAPAPPGAFTQTFGAVHAADLAGRDGSGRAAAPATPTRPAAVTRQRTPFAAPPRSRMAYLLAVLVALVLVSGASLYLTHRPATAAATPAHRGPGAPPSTGSP